MEILPQPVRDEIDNIMRDFYELPAMPRAVAHRILTLSHENAFLHGKREGLKEANDVIHRAFG